MFYFLYYFSFQSFHYSHSFLFLFYLFFPMLSPSPHTLSLSPPLLFLFLHTRSSTLILPSSSPARSLWFFFFFFFLLPPYTFYLISLSPPSFLSFSPSFKKCFLFFFIVLIHFTPEYHLFSLLLICFSVSTYISLRGSVFFHTKHERFTKNRKNTWLLFLFSGNSLEISRLPEKYQECKTSCCGGGGQYVL